MKLTIHKIPEQWAVTTIGNICDVQSGIGFPKQLQGREDGEVPFFKVGDISNTVQLGSRYLSKANNYISKSEVNELKGRLFLPETIVFAKIGEAIKLNRRAILSQPSLVDNNVMGIKAYQGIDLNYLYHFMCFIKLDSLAKATTVPSIRKGQIEDIEVPLPSTSNQKSISSKIEELFSHIDAGVEGLKQAKAKLQHYRQSVLKDAVTGKLTEQWRAQNADKLEPAEHFLKRILDERRAKWEAEQLKAFEEKGKTPKNDKWKDKYKVVDPLTERDVAGLPLLPEGWCYAKLGQVIDDPKYGTSKKCTYDSKGKGVLRIPNIAAGEINPEDMKYAEFTDDEIATYKLNEGDILTIRSNGSVSLVGKCAVISDKDTDFLFAGYLIRLRPVLKFIDANYLKSILTSGFLRKQIEMLAKSSSGVNNINTGELQSLIIPVCSLQEQRVIAQDIESKNTSINRQFEEYDRLFNQASKNKSAILKKAFSGELVENSKADETAEQLLEKIHAEKVKFDEKAKLAKKKPTARAKKMKRRPILDVLKESKKALSVDELFELSGFQTEVTPQKVEEFYQELKDVTAAKGVNVTPVKENGAKQGDVFEYKEVTKNEAR
ncbi:restriction endonuclease subunit S [Vibrio vulnificus]|uniref:restriction endonuclease subunit S n=1 Tax=Vibrio vulnificus TaxID=672 RepID=UPI001EEC8413|nr:restriction endonuclease subunit S [Vibrio vulnificus]